MPNEDLIDAPTAFDMQDPILQFMADLKPELEHPESRIASLLELGELIKRRLEQVQDVRPELVLELDRKALEELRGSSV